ncbi:ribbon-helix-helix domain-containing protein [Roseibium sp.]|uniref:ribbon-helix-helix domain-containing protein n=1 Tax=Roseibium sp. TaxID=1936156 RepID=UPI003D12E423
MADDFMTAFQKLVDRAHTDASEPVFKAVTVEGGRRALRLERSFWEALKLVAGEYQISVGEAVDTIARAQLNEKNLTSAVRHACIHAMTEKVEEDRAWFSEASVQHLVEACPSPVFALSANRQLRFTNQAFLKFVRTNLAGTDFQSPDAPLRLLIDLPMDKLISRLRETRNRPVSVGFAIGVNERRVRGTINALLAPEWRHTMVLGFVVA